MDSISFCTKISIHLQISKTLEYIGITKRHFKVVEKQL